MEIKQVTITTVVKRVEVVPKYGMAHYQYRAGKIVVLILKPSFSSSKNWILYNCITNKMTNRGDSLEAMEALAEKAMSNFILLLEGRQL